MIDVWFASVTVGSDAIAPCPSATPISMRRATFGASPRAAMSYEHVRVRAVEQEADDVARPLARVEQVGERRRRPGRARYRPSSSRSAARSRAARRSSARRRRAAPTRGTSPSLRTPLPREHERRPGLHEAERAVLAEVAALVLPVVRGGVQHAQVGRGRARRRAGRSGRTRGGRRSRTGAGTGGRARRRAA